MVATSTTLALIYPQMLPLIRNINTIHATCNNYGWELIWSLIKPHTWSPLPLDCEAAAIKITARTPCCAWLAGAIRKITLGKGKKMLIIAVEPIT
jgi:hypothetical protein